MDTRKLNRRAEICKALGEDTRIRIMAMLFEVEGPVSVTEIQKRLNMRQPNVSRHLTVLKNAGMVTAKREGKWIRYSPAPGDPSLVTRCVIAGAIDPCAN